MDLKYKATGFLLFCCMLAKAQFSDSVQYRAYFNSSGTFNRTNAVSSYLLNNVLKLSAQKKKVTCNWQSRWLYGKQSRILTNNDYSSTFEVNLYKSFPHFNYWGLFNYSSSYSLKINSQLQSGLGVAYTLIDKKRIKLNVSDGLLYEFSSIIATDSVVEEYSTVRNSLRIKFSGFVRGRVTLSAIGFYQPSLLERSDYIIKSDISLSIKIRKWISINATFSYNRMNRTRAENFLLTYGFIFERYF